MALAFGRLRVKSNAIILHAKPPPRALVYPQGDGSSTGMFADIGQRLLNHMQHLHLHIGRQQLSGAAAVKKLSERAGALASKFGHASDQKYL